MGTWYTLTVRTPDGRTGAVALAPVEPAGWMGDGVDVPGIGTVHPSLIMDALGSPPLHGEPPTEGHYGHGPLDPTDTSPDYRGWGWTLAIGTGPAPAGAVTDAG